MKHVVDTTLSALEKATLLNKGQNRAAYYVAMFEAALPSEQLPEHSTVEQNHLSMERGAIYLLEKTKRKAAKNDAGGIFIDI
jgi:hypothetical protein